MVWDGDTSALSDFVEYINTNSLNLQFSVQSSNLGIDFLDVALLGVPSTDMVSTTAFRKAYSGNMPPAATHPTPSMPSLTVNLFVLD